MRHFFILLYCSLHATIFGQMDSVLINNQWRSYFYTVPTNIPLDQSTGLVINMHGLHSNALEQRAYSGFDQIAEQQNFIVLYPNAINGQWNLTSSSDIDFFDHLIQKFRKDYPIGNCLFFTGISYGGFMAYKMACVREDITAIAPIAGNMTKLLQNTCSPKHGLPIMHFHGTDDGVVSIDGVPPLIPAVEQTIQWWVKTNQCNASPHTITLANQESNDITSVERIEYVDGSNESNVVYYKIHNGGHTWPGASIDVLPLGVTTHDINASQVIGHFFRQTCEASTSTTEELLTDFTLSPNPVLDVINIDLSCNDYSIMMWDNKGQLVMQKQQCYGKVQISTTSLPQGLYVLQILGKEVNIKRQLLVLHH